jgi:hypothetical protein
LMDLVGCLLLPNDKVLESITSQMLSSSGSFLSLEETLMKLYESRGDADFEIKIKGSETREKVHSFVMYSNWPYFRTMYDAGLKEKSEHRLELPSVGDDGGMVPDVLQLIIELCYKPKMSKQDMMQLLDTDLASFILPVAGLYLENHENDSKGVLDYLVEAASSQIAASDGTTEMKSRLRKRKALEPSLL